MNYIKLEGSPKGVGLTLGKILKNFLPVIPKIDKKRIEKFKDIVNDIAPYWIDEIKGISQSTGIDENLIIMFNCEKLRPNKFYIGNCTSFLVMPDRSKNKSPLLMKIRDEMPYKQIAGIKKIKGNYKYIFGTNIGNIGIAHFLNEKFLAGANNTGSSIISGVTDIGLSDCHILRIIAEKASNCEEAIKILNELISKKYVYNAGYKKGMIFLFSDNEKGAIVEMTAEKIWYRFVNKGTYVYTNHFLSSEMQQFIDENREKKEKPSESSRIRYKRGFELINKKETIDVEYLKKISNDKINYPYSLYNTSDLFPWRTVSVFIHYLSGIGSFSLISNRLIDDKRFYKLKIKDKNTPLKLLKGD